MRHDGRRPGFFATAAAFSACGDHRLHNCGARVACTSTRRPTPCMTGRRRAKRDGNPTASEAMLLGAPVDADVGHHFSHYRMTSSARSVRDCGKLRLRRFAVRKLTTKKNRDSCSIGSAAGIAPRKILETYSAARRHVAYASVP